MTIARHVSIRLLMVMIGLIAVDLGIVRALSDGGPTWPMFAFVTFPMINLLIIVAPRLRRGSATRPYYLGFALGGWAAVVGVGWLYWLLPLSTFFWPIVWVHALVRSLNDFAGFTIEIASAVAFYFAGQLFPALMVGKLSAQYRISVAIERRRSAPAIQGANDGRDRLADEKWSTAALRVFSERLTPEELVAALGIEADDSARMGEPIGRRPGSRSVRRTNAIFVRSGLAGATPLEDHLAALVGKLERVAPAVRALAGRASVDLFCGFSSGNGQGGFTLGPELLARLAALGLEVSFDLYPPGDAG